MSEICPKCGAGLDPDWSEAFDYICYECNSSSETDGSVFEQSATCVERVVSRLESALAAATKRAEEAEQENARLREGIAWLECDIRTADLAQLPEKCDEWEAFAIDALCSLPAAERGEGPATAVRRRWLGMMGMSESEIDDACRRDPPVNLDAELAELVAMVRIRCRTAAAEKGTEKPLCNCPACLKWD